MLLVYKRYIFHSSNRQLWICSCSVDNWPCKFQYHGNRMFGSSIDGFIQQTVFHTSKVYKSDWIFQIVYEPTIKEWFHPIEWVRAVHIVDRASLTFVYYYYCYRLLIWDQNHIDKASITSQCSSNYVHLVKWNWDSFFLLYSLLWFIAPVTSKWLTKCWTAKIQTPNVLCI